MVNEELQRLVSEPVKELLERTGSDACRPEDLDPRLAGGQPDVVAGFQTAGILRKSARCRRVVFGRGTGKADADDADLEAHFSDALVGERRADCLPGERGAGKFLEGQIQQLRV